MENTNVDTELSQANALISNGREEEAILLLEHMLECQPWSVQIQSLLCTLYLDTGRTEIPSSWVANTIKEDPDIRQRFIDVARQHRREERLDMSNDILRALVWADPENVQAWSLLGAIRFDLGDLWTAEKSLLHALHIDPAHLDSVLLLVKLYLALDKPDRAEAVAREALDRSEGASADFIERITQAMEPCDLEKVHQLLAMSESLNMPSNEE